MLALLTVFEHLSNVRRLLNRFQILWTNPSNKTSTKCDQLVRSDSICVDQEQREILLGPILKNILSDSRLDHCEVELLDDLQQDERFARELDACLLEIREIERDLNLFKQRQCSFYEKYLDFMEKKDQLIDMFIEYHDQYVLPASSSLDYASTNKLSRSSSITYQFNVPVSNRFALLERQIL